MSTTSTFRTSRSFPYTAAAIFKAFADGVVLASWWGPHGFTNEFEQFDFRTGGTWKFVMIGPDGTRYQNASAFVSVEPARRLIVRHSSVPHFSLTVELTPVEGGTRIEWIQEFDDPSVAAAMQNIVVRANEENLDRLGVALDAMAGG
jgi:uncharacterized protein YndB with AHSA1/START domain